MTELVVKLRLEADGKGMVGELKLADGALRNLGKNTAQASTEAQKYVDNLDRQAKTLGLNTQQARLFDLSQQKLTGTQRESAEQMVATINAHERNAVVLGRLTTAATAAGLAVGAVLGLTLRSAVNEANEAGLAQARLAAVLRATGGAAGLTAKQLNDMADQVARATLFDDEQIRNGQAVLLSFRNVQGDTFREGLALAADMSALLGGDLQSRIIQVGKALNEPTEGITALSRAGVTYSAVQKDQIRNYQETNQLGAAQRIVLDELSAQLGGTAEALKKAENGSRQLKESWDDLLEALGQTRVVGGGARSMFNLLANSADLAREAMERAAKVGVGRDGQLSALPAPPSPRTPSNLLGGMTADEYKAKASAFDAEQKRNAETTKAARDKQDLSALEARSASANKLKEIHDQMYDAVLTPQEKYFARLKEIAEVEKVYGEEIAGRAAQKAGEQFIAEEAASPQGKQSAREEAERASFEAAQAQQQARSATRLAEIETSLQTENERIEAAYLAREFMLEDARQRGLVSEQRYHELSTQMWAQSEADKSAIAMREAEQREQRDTLEFQNKMSMAGNVSSLLGSLASLSEGRGKKEFETSQRLARAQTIVSTATAAMQSYAWATKFGGPIAGAAAAAAAIGVGLAQLNRINETKYSGGGSIASATGGSAGGSVPGTDSGGVSGSGGSSNGNANGAGNGGITQITLIGSSGDTLTVGQMEQAFDHIRDGIARGDKILIERQSMQAQILSAA